MFSHSIFTMAVAALLTDSVHITNAEVDPWSYLSVKLPTTLSDMAITHMTYGNSSATNGVVFALEYSWQNKDGTAFPASTTYNTTNYLNGTNYAHLMWFWPAIDGTGKEESSMLNLRLQRLQDDAADDFTSDCFVFEFDIHYQINRPMGEINVH